MNIRHLLSVGALACFCPLLMGQTSQPPAATTPSGVAAQTTPPTFPPGTAREGGQEKSRTSTSKAAGRTKSFSGRVAKESTGYCLRVGDLAYKLDDQNRASGFDGQSVRVLGKLDKTSNTIQIDSIEPAQ